MTAVCGGGASGLQPGRPTGIVVDQAYVQSLLPPALAWLFPYLSFMQGLEIGDVGAFCAVDPPTFTVPTGTEIFNFVTGQPLSDYQLVSNFIQAITRVYLWYSLCQCSTVATPAAPAPPAAPSGLPAINPTGIVGVAPGPCVSNSYSANYIVAGSQNDIASNTAVGSTGEPTLFSTVRPIPPGATHFQLWGTTSAPGQSDANTAHFWGPVVQLYSATPTFLLQSILSVQDFGVVQTINAGFHSPVTAIPAGATQFLFYETTNTGGFPWAYTARLDWFCGDGTNSGSPPVCCSSTDPVTQHLLAQIFDLVTLIQRQAVPFAYITGAAHSGLTGNGVLTVQGLLGLRIDITTVPGRLGRVLGDPVSLWDAGWINLGTADGFGPRVFITSNPVLELNVSPAVTRIGYSIPGDVAVTITELVREP